MLNINLEAKINRIVLLLAWVSAISQSIVQYFYEFNIWDVLIRFFLCLLFLIISSVVYIYNNTSVLIRYFIVCGVVFGIFTIMYIKNGALENTYYLILIIASTAIFFDVKFTLSTTLFVLISSSFLYISFKSKFFPIVTGPGFVTMSLSFLITGIIIAFQTFWSRKIIENQSFLYIKATKDELTGVFNRAYYELIFKKLVSNHQNEKKDLSIILLDIDYFKKINDSYGHSTGDLVLKELASRIILLCRKSDIIARIGGEEFIVILENTDEEQAMTVAEKIRKVICDKDIENINVTISIGITSLKLNDSTDSIFNRADEALYCAKNSGRNRIMVK